MSRIFAIALVCIAVPSAAFNLRHEGSSLVAAGNEKPIPDPTCKKGVMSPDMKVCCTDDCGLCGNHKLCDNPGKYNEKTGKLVDNCCKDRILKKKVSCDKDHPPCVLSPSYKKSLDNWKHKEPSVNAADDCGEAETINRLRTACGVEKGAILGRLWVARKDKYQDGVNTAKDIKDMVAAKIKESEKVAKEHEFIFGEITKKAKKLQERAEKGLKDVKQLRDKLIKVKCVDKFDMSIQKLEADSDIVDRDTEDLRQVWQDWKKLKDLEHDIADSQTKLDMAEQRLEQLTLGEKMMLAKIEARNKQKCIPAGDAITQLKEAQKSMQKKGEDERAKLIPGQIAKATEVQKSECQHVEDLKKAHKLAKEANEKQIEEVEADKLELQKDIDEEDKLRDMAEKRIMAIIDKYTTTTTTTTIITIVNASGNNGAAYCSAYCAYNWNSQVPSFWKGACCLKAYDANNFAEVSCTAYGSGAGTICTCQRDDSAPFITDPAVGTGGSFSNMNNVCADATGVATLTPTTTTAPTTTTTNLDCNCFHCGSNSAFNNADVCGPASGGCGPSSPDNGGCWTNRDSGCVCSTHTLIQQCQCFHCGNSDPFPSADVCGAASGSCGPSSPNNGGCWTNVDATCQCGSQQTTGR